MNILIENQSDQLLEVEGFNYSVCDVRINYGH